MIKICSLEFLNKNEFDTDILLEDGRVLFSAGSAITPELLLRLYYKDIYVNKNLFKEEFKKELKDKTEEIQAPALSETVKSILPKNSEETLEFDEQQAQRVADYSVKLGQKIGMEPQQLEELKQAAYYHNIGRTKLTKADLDKNDFKKRQAEEGYNFLITEKNFSEKIAEAAIFYNRKYQGGQINLSERNYYDLPYSHIVAITNYYDELINKNTSKDDVLKQMLQLGGNKFNIFILHKFINMMRNSND